MAKSIVSETYQCPVCGEKSYIEYDSVTTKKVCLSCGYDGSQTDFVTL
jgi:ribosomal protein L37E